MALKQAGPGEGPSRGRAYFRYVGTVPGRKWCAYIAGPCQWYVCHTKGKSKPCLEWMTDGALPCKLCASTARPMVIGYQPLYRQVDSAPVMVIVYEDVRHVVDALRLHERVEIERQGQQGDAVSVTRLLTQEPRFQTTLPERRERADITDVLLALWSLPDLTHWYRCRRPASDNAVSLATDPGVTSTGEPFGPMTKAAAEKYGSDDDGPMSGALDDVIRNRLALAAGKKPATNGKHKPPPKG